MSDVNLLVFGCGVTFIAVAGAYVYIREAFTDEERRSEPQARSAEVAQGKARDVV